MIAHAVTIDNKKFTFYDIEGSGTVDIVAKELNIGDYNMDGLDVKQSDVILDIGAHVGMASIYWGKKYPDAKIYAFEPNDVSFECLKKNLEVNQVNNVVAYNVAITSDRRMVDGISRRINSGNSMSFYFDSEYNDEEFTRWRIHSVTLNDIFMLFDIGKCKILKTDCEGAEYEIVKNTSDVFLGNVEYLFGEFHMTDCLRDMGYNIYDLLGDCNKYIDNIKVVFYDNCDGKESAHRCVINGWSDK